MTDFNNQEMTNENDSSNEGFVIENKKKKMTKNVIIAVVVVALIAIIGIVLYFALRDDSPKVTLGQYKDLTYKAINTSVSDSEIQEEIDRVIKSKVSYKKLDDREGTPLVEGDIANCSYKALYDGKVVEEATGNFVIGQGDFKAFEEAILGKNVGETVTVIAEIPVDYKGSEALESVAGKEVSFDVKINFVSLKNVPEITDEFVNTVTNGECTSAAAYRDYVKTKLENKKKEAADTEIVRELTTKVIEGAKFEKIDEQIDEYYNTMYSTYESAAKHYELSMDDYTKQFHEMNLDDFKAKLKETMSDLVKEQLVLKKIAEVEKLEVNKDKYDELMNQYLKEYGYTDVSEFVDYYGEESIEESMLYDYAIEFILKNAKAE